MKMNYKDFKIMYENFKILPDGRVYGINMYSAQGKEIIAGKNIEEILKDVIEVKTPVEKGYIYAANFFYLEIEKQVKKLRDLVAETFAAEKFKFDALPKDKLNTKTKESEMMDLYNLVDAAVREKVGNTHLSGIVKEFFAEKQGIRLLTKTQEETDAIEGLREAYASECLTKLYEDTIARATSTDDGTRMKFQLTREFISSLTELQKVVFAPALRLCAFTKGMKIEGIKIGSDFVVSYSWTGDVQESEKKESEQVKINLKRILTQIYS